MILKSQEVIEQQFFKILNAFRNAPTYLKAEQKTKLLSKVETLLRKSEGIALVYRYIDSLDKAGLFVGTPWEKPVNLVPGLVGGTLLAGLPTSTMEVLSELRVLSIAEGHIKDEHFSADDARAFIQDILVKNFNLAAENFDHEAWNNYQPGELKKINLLFDLILSKVPLLSIKQQLLTEIEMQAAHRPIMTQKVVSILQAIQKHLTLKDSDSMDQKLGDYYNAHFYPTSLAKKYYDQGVYREQLAKLRSKKLEGECETMGASMMRTGLVANAHVTLLKYLADKEQALIPLALSLNAHGEAEFQRHKDLVIDIIQGSISYLMPQGVFGLARVLQRNLFSRHIVRNAFRRLLQLKIHPEIAKKLRLSNVHASEDDALNLLVNGTLCVLGQPLGVRQGNNPTCQSARGISMWSRNAPGKLLNLVMDAANSDNLIMRFEGKLLESAKIQGGLIQRLDYKLDPVSIVLVPHLDKIYNQMMHLAMVRHIGKDPHVSVNPAFYGHWIQTGFRSVYNPLTNKVENYRDFLRIFYASYHPDYNGGHHIVYPVPLGIYITDSKAEMRGFHAISLQRVKMWEGEWRAYFFNPNSEGKQNWGQGIIPTVYGNGERSGESSLPFHQFVSRVYAFHFNKLRLGEKPMDVDSKLIDQVEKTARESWGRSYFWSNNNIYEQQ